MSADEKDITIRRLAGQIRMLHERIGNVRESAWTIPNPRVGPPSIESVIELRMDADALFDLAGIFVGDLPPFATAPCAAPASRIDPEPKPTVCEVRSTAAAEPRGRNQRVVRDVALDLLRQSALTAQGGAPDGAPCISLGALIEACRERMEIPMVRVPERVQVAVKALANRGIVAVGDGWLWEPLVVTTDTRARDCGTPPTGTQNSVCTS